MKLRTIAPTTMMMLAVAFGAAIGPILTPEAEIKYTFSMDAFSESVYIKSQLS